MKEIKKILLRIIVLSAEEIKNNLERSADPIDVKANAEAMVMLAEAYKKVKGR